MLNRDVRLGLLLGFQDTRQAYRRSALGPFWLTIGMAIQVLSIGVVFGLIFGSQLSDYLPFLTVSIVIWGFISSTFAEGCLAFIAAESIIKQLRISFSSHIIRVLCKNSLITAHNAVIVPVVLLAFNDLPGLQIAALIPGIALLTLNLAWCVWLLAMVSARFRDAPPIISSVMTVAFYVTPVMWFPSLIGDDSLAHFLLGLNPFYHWIQIVRLPILGEWPTPENWTLATLSAIIGLTITYFAHRKFKNMIAYWV